MRELRITQKGAILLSKTINSPLIFTNMALGSGVLESWDDSIEGMIAQVLKEAVSDVNVSNGQITFRTVFKNESLEIGFYVNEIGVFAQDPDEGEILFAYTNSFGEETDYMEKGTGSKIIKYIIDIAMAFTNNVEVKLLVDPSKNYISVDKIANDLDTDDPSKVLAASMGKKLKNPEFDDSGTVESISSFTDFINSVKNKMNIFQFFRNFKAGMKYVLHTGMIVNNFTSERGDLPGSAANDKQLYDMITDTNNNIKYETIDISDCSSLKEIVDTMKNNRFKIGKNNRFKIGVGSVGNLQSSNLKTLLSNPSGFGNYTLVQAEFITERMIHLYAITLGVTPPIQVDGYITYNNVELSWSGWKSYVTNSDLSIINNSTLVTSTVPSGITTAIRTITIPPGTYLITGLLTFNESINVQCNYSIDSDKGMLVMCRSSGINGGGQSPCTLENFTETTKIILNAYQNSGKSVDIAYSNLKLIKFK